MNILFIIVFIKLDKIIKFKVYYIKKNIIFIACKRCYLIIIYNKKLYY